MGNKITEYGEKLTAVKFVGLFDCSIIRLLLVGALLILVSLILATESRSLLMGESISQDTQEKIRELLRKDEAVVKVLKVISSYYSPEEVVLILIVNFKPDLNTHEITAAIKRMQQKIRENFPLIKYITIGPYDNLKEVELLNEKTGRQ